MFYYKISKINNKERKWSIKENKNSFLKLRSINKVLFLYLKKGNFDMKADVDFAQEDVKVR